MNLSIQGKGRITLDKGDYVSQGGQGQIFRKGNIAFKVFLSSKSMISVEKIKELSCLTMPQIIKPKDILIDNKGTPIGYTMTFLSQTHALCQIFTKSFRDRNGLSHDKMLNLVEKLKTIVEHCHKNNILIVDLNELNFLVSNNMDEVFAIDCDSYQTPSFPATAIMESIRDRHSNNFNELTDWFSFGIISFQMFTGIHPYKGKHPKIKNLEERMIKNISVFNKDVSMPPVCYPINIIPDIYRNWYESLFERGERIPPPSKLSPHVTIVNHVQNFVLKGKFLDITKIFSLDEEIVHFNPFTKTLLTKNEIFQDNKSISKIKKHVSIGLSQDGILFSAEIENGKLKIKDITWDKNINIDSNADDIMEYGGRVYIRISDNVYEINVVNFNSSNKVFATLNPVCQVMENSTKMYDGVVVQNILGSCYVSVFPSSQTCIQIHVKEINGKRLIYAKYDNGVLITITFDNGKYCKNIIRISEEDQVYDYRVITDCDLMPPNFVSLPSNICICLNDLEEIEIFSSKPFNNIVKTIKDKVLSNDIILSKYGNKAVFYKEKSMYYVEMIKNN